MPKSIAEKAPEPGTRTLLVEQAKGKFKVTIPADWKVTFGITRSPREDRFVEMNGGGGRDLRLYESGDHCRAVFTGVTTFRDLAIPVSRLVINKAGSETWEDDGEGNTNATQSRTAMPKWVEEG